MLERSSPELTPEFLPYIMSAERFHEHSIKQSKGSVNPYINYRDLTWYQFPLPSRDILANCVSAKPGRGRPRDSPEMSFGSA